MLNCWLVEQYTKPVYNSEWLRYILDNFNYSFRFRNSINNSKWIIECENFNVRMKVELCTLTPKAQPKQLVIITRKVVWKMNDSPKNLSICCRLAYLDVLYPAEMYRASYDRERNNSATYDVESFDDKTMIFDYYKIWCVRFVYVYYSSKAEGMKRKREREKTEELSEGKTFFWSIYTQTTYISVASAVAVGSRWLVFWILWCKVKPSEERERDSVLSNSTHESQSRKRLKDWLLLH